MGNKFTLKVLSTHAGPAVTEAAADLHCATSLHKVCGNRRGMSNRMSTKDTRAGYLRFGRQAMNFFGPGAGKCDLASQIFMESCYIRRHAIAQTHCLRAAPRGAYGAGDGACALQHGSLWRRVPLPALRGNEPFLRCKFGPPIRAGLAASGGSLLPAQGPTASFGRVPGGDGCAAADCVIGVGFADCHAAGAAGG